MAISDIKQLIAELYPPDRAPDMPGAFGERAAGAFATDADLVRERVAEIRREQEAVDIGWKAEEQIPEAGSRKIETLDDIRQWATALEAMKTDDERRDALAGITSGRMIASYFSFLDKRRAEAQAANRKADREAHYMALLYAQLAELDAEIGRLDGLIDDLRNEIAQIDAEIDALQQALDGGDFSGAAAQRAIDDYNSAHPDNPVDPNDPNDARRAVQWAQRNKKNHKDDLQSRMDDAIVRRDDMIRDRGGLKAEIDELEAAAAKGQDALDAKADLEVSESSSERIEAIRAQSNNRAINESFDHAQGWNDNGIEKLARFRDQQEARLSTEADTSISNPSAELSAIPDLNGLDLNSPPALDGSARTTSVADNLNRADTEELEIKSTFSKVSSLNNLEIAQIGSDIDLNRASGSKVDDLPGAKPG